MKPTNKTSKEIKNNMDCEVDSIFPCRLKQLLTDRKITPSELACAVDVFSQRVYSWLNGKSEPSYATLVKIADYLEVTADYLIGRSNCELETTSIMYMLNTAHSNCNMAFLIIDRFPEINLEVSKNSTGSTCVTYRVKDDCNTTILSNSVGSGADFEHACRSLLHKLISNPLTIRQGNQLIRINVK